MKCKMRILALAMAIVMTVPLAACGGDDTPAPTDEATATAAAEGNAATEVAPAVEKPESITFLTKEYFKVPEYGAKVEEIFLADTGVTLEIIDVPDTNWEDKVMTTFVSGDIPDIARVGENIYPLVVQDFLLPLNEVAANNPELEAIFKANPAVYEPYTLDGQVYGVSVNNPKYMTMWIREDWLTKLGKPMPTTMDELVEILILFRDSDLDGNGVDDTVPLTMPSILMPHNVFAGYFGTRNSVHKKDGTFVEPFTTPEYKEYLEFMKMLYDEKLLDQEVPTLSSMGAVRSKYTTQVAGSIVMWDDNYLGLTNALIKNGITDAKTNYVPAFDGEKGTFGYSYFKADSPIAITKACENPQGVFDVFFDWYFNSENGIMATSRGIEGYSYTLDENGVMVPNEENSGGIGFHGQSMPPIKKDFVYPYKFNEVSTIQYEKIVEIGEYGTANFDKVGLVSPTLDNIEYNAVFGELDAKVNELYYKFLLGEITYEEYIAAYTDFRAEIGMDEIMASLNS